jgi:hypothetical protein
MPGRAAVPGIPPWGGRGPGAAAGQNFRGRVRAWWARWARAAAVIVDGRNYALGIGLAAVDRWLSVAVYVIVALMWLIPGRRVERVLAAGPGGAADAPPGP